VGLFRRVVRAPRKGQVIVAGGGQVLLQTQSKPFELKAGVPGTVVELIADRGAIIETTGALVQGVWGNGAVDYGLVHNLASSPEQALPHERLDVSLRGSVVVGGYCDDEETLKTAESLPLRGLILASLSTALASQAAHLTIPLILIEGFGFRPMNSAAFKILTTSERREAAVIAEPWDRYGTTRPEVVIPLPSERDLPLPHETDFFSPGQPVRVLRAPAAGKIGTLANLMGLTVFPGGLRVQAGEVRLENGESLVVPLANLEILA
jgi:hypothetical protein